MRTFNPNRLIPLELNGDDQHLTITELIPLRAAIRDGRLSASAPVLYTARGTPHGQTDLVFETRHFSLYNVMQGVSDGEAWLATFCAVCNAGMSFSPIVDGVTYTFYGAGFYDAMTLLADIQTRSYWDHITGVCISGAMQGARLDYLSSMTHSRAGVIALTKPDAQWAVSALDAQRAPLIDVAEAMRTSDQPMWLPAMRDSLDLDVEDTRLPRLEMGLGVWTGGDARFYRFQTMHMLDNHLFDTLNGERLLVYVDPDTLTPAALYTEATRAEWRGDALILDNGARVQNGALIVGGVEQPARRPLQLFQRWYGFSTTFAGCTIYRAAR
jgi:hypothetical protein